MSQFFDDADAVARYAEGPRRLVPGHDALLTMTEVLLSERLSQSANLLVIGAGGGLEMAHFAQAHPQWHYTGIDPSAKMLALAASTLGQLADRATLINGYAADAPQGPFDAATCLLTLHFVPVTEKLATLQAIRSRLKPGAPFVIAHHSVPGDPAERAQWFLRFAAFGTRSGVFAGNAHAAATKIAAELPIVSPAEDAALLVRAGFSNVHQFYAAFTFRGWVCTAL
jgi:tRNA (cmo5U34)-methyltransferase